jgi:hypothetical protein
MAHVLESTAPKVQINIPFDRKLHARMVSIAKSQRQSMRQLVLRLVDDGLARLERERKEGTR